MYDLPVTLLVTKFMPWAASRWSAAAKAVSGNAITAHSTITDSSKNGFFKLITSFSLLKSL
jgi:hypothetical protein